MKTSQYVLFEPGGLTFSGYEYGKLVERRYIELEPTQIQSANLEEFLNLLRAALDRYGVEKMNDCRVGYGDDNGVGNHYDALEFLANDGALFSPTITPATEARL